MTDTNLREMSIEQLYSNRKLLDQLVRAVATTENVGYVQAYDRISQGVVDDGLMPSAPVARMLEAAGVRVPEVEQHVKVLDAADGSVQRVYEEAKPKQLDTDDFGRIRVGKKLAKKLDADGRLTDKATFEKRLKRVRLVAPQYAGDAGRRAFEQEDELNLRSGIDVVKTLEATVAERVATAQADQTRRELDQGIAEQVEQRRALKLLDGEQSELDGRRQKLEQQPAAGGRALRLLDAPSAGKKATDMNARIRERMRRLGLPEIDYVICLEAEQRGDPMPPEPAAQPAAAPFGVHPEHHDLNARIVKYLDDNNLPDSAYTDTVEGFYSGRIVL